jgi:hypothetical protein
VEIIEVKDQNVARTDESSQQSAEASCSIASAIANVTRGSEEQVLKT